MTPAIAVVAKRASVVAGVASPTRRSTRGGAGRGVAGAGTPDESQHPRQRGCGAGHRLFEIEPPSAEILRALVLGRLLDARVARYAAVGGTGVGRLTPAQPPVHRRRACARAHHSHLACRLPTSLKSHSETGPLLSDTC